MNATRLDRLARRLAVETTRRGALAMAAAVVGLTANGEGAAHRRPPCPPCHRRRRGRCRPQPDGTGCAECAVCNAGVCDLAPDDTPCGGDGRCRTGRCFARPSCQSVGTICRGNSDCCSGDCVNFIGAFQCFPSAEGDPCLADTDCQPGLTCFAYACRA